MVYEGELSRGYCYYNSLTYQIKLGFYGNSLLKMRKSIKLINY